MPCARTSTPATWGHEDAYLIDFPFDGLTVEAEATFVSGDEILIGTGMLAQHRLEIVFPARTVLIEKVP